MSRLARLKEKMSQEEIDGFLITSPYNLRYFTNFTGTTGLALVTKEQAFFCYRF